MVETATSGTGHAVSLQETPSETFTVSATVILEPFGGTTGDSVRLAPPFDLLLVRLSADALTAPSVRRSRAQSVQRYDPPVEHAMRFIRVRRPAGVLFIWEGLPAGLADAVRLATKDKMAQFGYRVEYRTGGGLEAIAAVLSTKPFPWPVVPTLDGVIPGLARVALEPAMMRDEGRDG